jgi:uncharacterized protein YacL
MRKGLVSLLSLPLFLFLAAPAYAQADICGGRPGFDALCKIKVEKGGNVIGPAVMFFIVIAIIVCLVFLVMGGLKWTTSQGDQQKIAQARQTIIAAMVGLIIALCTFFIVATVLGVFGIDFGQLNVPKLVPK